MASNNQRSKLNHILRGKLREISGNDIEIGNDPLGSRYNVNKYGLVVEGDREVVIDTFDRLLALLTMECWTLDLQPGQSTVQVSSKRSDSVAFIYRPQPTMHGGVWRIGITVF